MKPVTHKTKKRAVFVDRDGTINLEKEYLHRSEEFEFVVGAPEAIKTLKDAGFMVVVVTNQSGVARGYIDELLATKGTSVDAYYFCPHHPEHGDDAYRVECDCRKPLPGMLMKAATDLGIDLSASWMIGDKLADIEAGIAAGCRTALVLTGYGESELYGLPPQTLVCADLLAAARAIKTI
jgi:D-glycero-D-manno-heptose 1,7-bisphosphate phosphatase